MANLINQDKKPALYLCPVDYWNFVSRMLASECCFENLDICTHRILFDEDGHPLGIDRVLEIVGLNNQPERKHHV